MISGGLLLARSFQLKDSSFHSSIPEVILTIWLAVQGMTWVHPQSTNGYHKRCHKLRFHIPTNVSIVGTLYKLLYHTLIFTRLAVGNLLVESDIIIRFHEKIITHIFIGWKGWKTITKFCNFVPKRLEFHYLFFEANFIIWPIIFMFRAQKNRKNIFRSFWPNWAPNLHIWHIFKFRNRYSSVFDHSAQTRWKRMSFPGRYWNVFWRWHKCHLAHYNFI